MSGEGAPLQVRSAAGDGPLEVGAATRDVTPPPGVPLWGYADAVRVAEGTRDPLHARALVLRVGGTALGLIALELGRVPPPEVCRRMRAAAARLGVDALVVTATHTHSGPVMELAELPHQRRIEEGALEALAEAARTAVPAALGVARTEIDIGFNRRVVRDGRCFMRWRNAERVPNPSAPIDREAGVIRFANVATGAPIATLVSLACHPVIFAADNVRYSADWPGEMCRALEAEEGGACLFLQGATGDVNPYLDKTPLDQGADANVCAEGRRAAGAVRAALQGLGVRVPATPSLAYREERVRVGTRWDLRDPEQARILKGVYGAYWELYMQHLDDDLAVPLGVLVLNGALALAFAPGELFVEHQLDLKRRSPLPATFLCGYANEYHAYFPTVRDIASGGYGAAVMSYVGAGAGETLITRATVHIGELAGRLSRFQRPEQFQVLDL